MAFLILDTKTVIYGAQDGISLCLQTIIPTLFPFIILSNALINILLGKKIHFLHSIGKLCNIPDGADSILLLGFLGGYPIGAKITTQTYTSRSVTKQGALRMLAFCSNAGPAFIFGILSTIFLNKKISWYLLITHIISAIIVGIILPRSKNSICKMPLSKQSSFQAILKDTTKTLSQICSWIIIFRILICIFEKWFFCYLSIEFQVILSGLLELSNGCISLSMLPSDEMKFIYASGMLAFGGLCVLMQTAAVVQELGCKTYFLGKVLQTLFSILISIIILPIIFPETELLTYKTAIFILIILILMLLYLVYRKKLWHLQEECCIIPEKIRRKEQLYAVSKEDAKIL